MKYSVKECFLLSLIYSSVTLGRYPKNKFNTSILYDLFFLSLKEEWNLFDLSYSERFKKISSAIERSKVRNHEKELEKIELFFEEEIPKLKEKVIEEIKICEKDEINFLTYFCKKYPKNLMKLTDPPFIIFYKGNLPDDEKLKKSLAIIGSRKPEKKFGEKIAFFAGENLSSSGYINISGLALGCDTYGHKGSLTNGKGKTGAILASGLKSSIYPKENTALSKEILEKDGFLMSEFCPTVKLIPKFLVLRDRLQSGMTRGIFVVETGVKSGTLHTVKYALEQNKEVYIWNPMLSKAKDCEEVAGNIALINNEFEKIENVRISSKYNNKIIPVDKREDLVRYLIENEKTTTNKKELENLSIWG